MFEAPRIKGESRMKEKKNNELISYIESLTPEQIESLFNPIQQLLQQAILTCDMQCPHYHQEHFLQDR